MEFPFFYFHYYCTLGISIMLSIKSRIILETGRLLYYKRANKSIIKNQLFISLFDMDVTVIKCLIK